MKSHEIDAQPLPTAVNPTKRLQQEGGFMRNGTGSCVGSFAGGVCLGAGLMYILDPNRGRTRRAFLREKGIRGIHVLQRETNKQLRNAGNHILGRAQEIRSSIRDRSRAIPDDILLDRLRAQLGRDVRHLRMLDFTVEDGCVIVQGPVLRGEAEKVQRRLSKTRGIRNCDLRVEEVSQPEMERLAGNRGFSPERAAM